MMFLARHLNEGTGRGPSSGVGVASLVTFPNQLLRKWAELCFVVTGACEDSRMGDAAFMRLPARLKLLWLTLIVAVIDRITKAWFETQTSEGWRHEVVKNLIYLVHSRNTGIAFSLFADWSSPWLRVYLVGGSFVVIAILAYYLVAGQGGALTSTGLALLLGGATGNVTDRIINGGVTDFLEVWIGNYRWPAFNVADSAITIGAVLLILDVFYFSARRRLME